VLEEDPVVKAAALGPLEFRLGLSVPPRPHGRDNTAMSIGGKICSRSMSACPLCRVYSSIR
jgi:hypothetical protein